MPNRILPPELKGNRNVEMLFRELARYEGPAMQEYKQAREKEEEIQARLLNVPEMRKAKADREKAWSKSHEQNRIIREAAQCLRREYLAVGLTPVVRAQLEKLVKAANKGK